MADEAVVGAGTRLSNNTRIYTVANNPAVPKGTLMFLSGDNTASFSAAGSGAIFAGIAMFNKEAGDGETVISCDIGGVYDLTASGAITLGTKVILAGGNRVQTANNGTAGAIASGGLVVGTAMEVAANGEIVRVDLDRK